MMTEQSIQQRLVELDTVVQASPQRVRRLSQTSSKFGAAAAARPNIAERRASWSDAGPSDLAPSGLSELPREEQAARLAAWAMALEHSHALPALVKVVEAAGAERSKQAELEAKLAEAPGSAAKLRAVLDANAARVEQSTNELAFVRALLYAALATEGGDVLQAGGHVLRTRPRTRPASHAHGHLPQALGRDLRDGREQLPPHVHLPWSLLGAFSDPSPALGASSSPPLATPRTPPPAACSASTGASGCGARLAAGPVQDMSRTRHRALQVRRKCGLRQDPSGSQKTFGRCIVFGSINMDLRAETEVGLFESNNTIGVFDSVPAGKGADQACASIIHQCV